MKLQDWKLEKVVKSDRNNAPFLPATAIFPIEKWIHDIISVRE